MEILFGTELLTKKEIKFIAKYKNENYVNLEVRENDVEKIICLNKPNGLFTMLSFDVFFPYRWYI